MKKRLAWSIILLGSLMGLTSHAKMSDKVAMKCISADKPTRIAFLDLEQAYEMRSVTAKDFVQVFSNASTCPQLRKNLNKLHGDMIAKLPARTNKSTLDFSSGSPQSSGDSVSPNYPSAPSAPYYDNSNLDEGFPSFID